MEEIEVINKEKQIEEAKKLLKEQENIEIELAIKEYNNFIKDWEEKHNCTIVGCGVFEGTKIEIMLKVVKKK